MSRPHRAAALALIAALLLPAACLPIRDEPSAVPAAREGYGLRPLLPLDTRGEAVLHGTLSGAGEAAGESPWRGVISVSRPAYVDGMLSEASVQARVDTATVVPGAPPADVRRRILDLAARRASVEIAVRRQGTELRAMRVTAVDVEPADIPSVDGALGVAVGGRASFRGPVAVSGAGAAAGTLDIDAVHKVFGIDVALVVPVRWDGSTTLVSSSGARRPLPEALRDSPDILSRSPVEVVYRRSADGVFAEEVRR